MNIAPNFPRIIQEAIRAISSLPDYIVKGVFAVEKNRCHKMHAQRRKSLQSILRSLLKHSDMATGKLVHIYMGAKYDVTVQDIVEESGLCRAAVCRVLAYLKAIGVLLVAPQNRAVLAFGNGTAQLSCSVTRSLSVKFWELLGLADAYANARERAADKAGQVKHVCSIKGTSGIHKGHSLPIPAPKSSQETPPAPPSQGVLEAIQRAREAQARAQKI